jgi:hypothetical protein
MAERAAAVDRWPRRLICPAGAEPAAVRQAVAALLPARWMEAPAGLAAVHLSVRSVQAVLPVVSAAH